MGWAKPAGGRTSHAECWTEASLSPRFHRVAAMLFIVWNFNANFGTNFVVVFLPPYSPELNPIGMSQYSNCY